MMATKKPAGTRKGTGARKTAGKGGSTTGARAKRAGAKPDERRQPATSATAATDKQAAPELERLDPGAGYDSGTGSKAGVVLEGTAVEVTDAATDAATDTATDAADGPDVADVAANGDAPTDERDATGAAAADGGDGSAPQQTSASGEGVDDAGSGAGATDAGAARETANGDADDTAHGSGDEAAGRGGGDAHSAAGAAAQVAPGAGARTARSGAGLGGMVLAALLGGGIGIGGAWWLDRNLPAGDDARSAQIAQQAQRIQALADLTKALDQRIAAQEARADTAAAPIDFGPVEDRIAALEARLNEVEAAQAALGDRIAAAGDQVQGGGSGLPEDVQARINELSDDLAARQAELNSLKEALDAELAQVKQEIEAAQSARDEVVRSARAEIALSRIEAALESGDPFAADVRTLRGAGLEIPDAVDAVAGTGAPTLLTLQDGFDKAARDALRASTAAGSEGRGGFVAFLKSQISTRSLEPRDGSDPDAVLSRARAAVMAGDLATALTEIAALPDPAKRALADWSGRAQARVDALAAVNALRSALATR